MTVSDDEERLSLLHASNDNLRAALERIAETCERTAELRLNDLDLERRWVKTLLRHVAASARADSERFRIPEGLTRNAGGSNK